MKSETSSEFGFTRFLYSFRRVTSGQQRPSTLGCVLGHARRYFCFGCWINGMSLTTLRVNRVLHPH